MNKKNVLGRGLNALIPRQPRMEVSVSGDHGHDNGEPGIIASIETGRIQANPFQPRQDFDAGALDELKRSIQEKGLIQPITVRRFEGGYQLVSGERRLRAAKELRLKQIPAYIMEVGSDEEMLELALIENIQREHLNPIEIAAGYQRLMDECHLTQEDVAGKVGKDRSTVTNFLRLLKLPDKIKEGLRKEKIQMGHARALIGLPSEKSQIRLYEKIVDGGLSVRKVEDMVRNTGRPSSKSTKSVHPSPGISLMNIEEKLRQQLGTKVTVKTKGSGKGELIIEFYSLDDFDRLLDLFAAGAKNI